MKKDEFNELDFIVNYLPYKVVITLVFAVAYFMIFDAKLDLNGDNAAYLNLGRALAEGEGYVNTSVPGNPPEAHFPAGYPLIIAALIKSGISGITGLKIANGILLYLSGMLWFQIIQMLGFRKNAAFVAVIAVFLNPLLMRFGNIIMSESAFLLFASLSIYCYLRSEPKTDRAIFKSPFFYTMIISAAAAFHIKTLGFIIPATVLLPFLLKKRFAVFLAGSAISFALMLLALFKPSGGENYMSQLLMINPYNPDLGTAGVIELGERIGKNFINYGFGVVQSAVFPLSSTYLKDFLFLDIVTGSIILYILYKGFTSARKHKALQVTFLSLTAFVLLLWPDVWTSPRYIVHLTPLLLLFFIAGLTVLTEKYRHLLPGKKQQGVFPAFLISLLSIIPLNDVRIKAQSDYPPNVEKYFALADWARINTDPSARFIARKPNLFHLHSKRKTLNYKNTTNDTAMMNFFAENDIDYVVLDQLGYGSTPKYLFPVLEKHSVCFKNVHAFPQQRTFLLSFDKELYPEDDYFNKLQTRRDSLNQTLEKEMNKDNESEKLPDQFLK